MSIILDTPRTVIRQPLARETCKFCNEPILSVWALSWVPLHGETLSAHPRCAVEFAHFVLEAILTQEAPCCHNNPYVAHEEEECS